MRPSRAPIGISKVSDIGRYMPMPTASGGSRSLVKRPSSSSITITTAPIAAPSPISPQFRLPPKTPCASAEISAACGAASAFSPAPGAPAKPNATLSRSSTGAITTDAEDHPDDQRDLLLPGGGADELAGLEVLQVVVGDGGDAEHDRGGEERVGDERRGALRVAARPCRATSTSDAPSTTRMPTPEIGLFDEPMRPAMYPATDAITAPIRTM